MTDKFQNTYRIASARLPGWDYGWNAPYFVTICTKDRECFFGEIVNGEMNLSKTGVIADLMWYEIKNHAKGVELGEFIVMPNHVHGIITLNGDSGVQNDHPDSTVETTHALSLPQIDQPGPNDIRRGSHPVETTHALSLQSKQSPIVESQKTPAQQRFQNQGKNTLSSIVGGYKSAVTKHANRLKLDFAWQPRFYDHIIRDEQSFRTISNYILNNPQSWAQDKFFK
jgi:REP element-mobilizing transposase RayT